MTGNTSASDLVERKGALRRQLRAARTERMAALKERESSGEDIAALREQEGRDLVRHLAPHLPRTLRRVSLYYPTPSEPNVVALIEHLHGLGAEVVLPVSSGGEELEWAVWDPASGVQASPGKGFGKEPQGKRLGTDALREADLLLIPALAIGLDGARLGHGGGYYDRALTTTKAPVVAVVSPEDVVPAGELPMEPTDVWIPAVLTREGYLRLPREA